MFRTVIVILIYHRHKPIDLIYVNSFQKIIRTLQFTAASVCSTYFNTETTISLTIYLRVSCDSHIKQRLFTRTIFADCIRNKEKRCCISESPSPGSIVSHLFHEMPSSRILVLFSFSFFSWFAKIGAQIELMALSLCLCAE
jgi:hypothetical protein